MDELTKNFKIKCLKEGDTSKFLKNLMKCID